MGYSPNNPLVPGDPYSYDLNWIIKKLKEAIALYQPLNSKFDNLYDYVHDYFSNTDFEQLVDDGLRALIADGSIAAVIQPIVDAYKVDFEAELATMNSRLGVQDENIAVLSSRMDTFASLPAGSTAGNAELLDIRVGVTGRTYDTAGNAVRGQINDREYNSFYISRELESVNDAVKSVLNNNAAVEEKHEIYLYEGLLIAGVPDVDPTNKTLYSDFIDNSAAADPVIYYDNATYKINVSVFDASKNFLSQTTYLTIQPFHVRSYITDPYIKVEIQRNDSAIIDRKAVSIYTKISLANNILYQANMPYIINNTVLTVKKDGTGDYTTVKGAIDAAIAAGVSYNNRYIIEIYEGIYDLKTEYSASWGTPGFIGCSVPDYVTLKGVGDKRKIILTAEDTTTAENIRILMATLNIHQATQLENLTVKGAGLKYTVHDDFDTGARLEEWRTFLNLIIEGENTITNAIWGAGAWPNTKTRFSNCIFKSNTSFAPFYMHNNTTAIDPTYVEMINCRMKSYNISYGDCILNLSTAGNPSQTPCYFYLYGSKVRTVLLNREGTASSLDWMLSGYANELNGIQYALPGYTENADLIASATYSRYSDNAY